MAQTKAAITKKYTLSAKGILDINEEGIGIENVETGEWIDLKSLLADFADRSINLSVNYDEEYDTISD